MIKKWQIRLAIGGFLAVLMILIAGAGCAKNTRGKSYSKMMDSSTRANLKKRASQDNEQTGVELNYQSQTETDVKADNLYGSSQSLSEEASSSSLSIEQLRSAEMGLEAFRVFCAHFKIQGDQSTLNSIKKPTMDYIKSYIDPILVRKHQLKNDEYSRFIITIYYLKAYIYYLFGNSQVAHDIVTQIQENLPPVLKTKTIYHIDKGEISVEAALHELNNLIADNSSED